VVVFGHKLLIWLSFSYCSRDIAMATNFRVKISKIGLLTFIRCLGIPKQIGISQFWFPNVQWQWSGFIV